MKNERDTAFLVKWLNYNKIQPVGDISEKYPFSSKKSIKSVKSGQWTLKMAQFEAYICIFNFQVLKTFHCIINSLKIELEVTENSENLAFLPPKRPEIGVLCKF